MPFFTENPTRVEVLPLTCLSETNFTLKTGNVSQVSKGDDTDDAVAFEGSYSGRYGNSFDDGG